MQPAFVNIDGKLVATHEAALPVDNRAFRYGWGLFETMLVQDGSLQLAAYHWQRLFDGLKQLCFDLPKLFTSAYLEGEVLRTVQKNKLEQLCRVRLQVYAGSGGILEEQTPKPQFLIECFRAIDVGNRDDYYFEFHVHVFCSFLTLSCSCSCSILASEFQHLC